MNKGAYIEENPDGGLGRRNLTNGVGEVKMSDILDRLRAGGEWINGSWVSFGGNDRHEAADEIEQLRACNAAKDRELASFYGLDIPVNALKGQS